MNLNKEKGEINQCIISASSHINSFCHVCREQQNEIEKQYEISEEQEMKIESLK